MTDRPLTGSDSFLLALDYESRHYNDAGHLAQFCLRVDDGFDPGQLSEAVADLRPSVPEVTSPIERPYYVAPPCFRLDKADTSSSILHVADQPLSANGDVPDEVQSRLNDVMPPSESRSLDIRVWPAEDDGWWVVFTWLHCLFDGRGIETFVRSLQEGRVTEQRDGDPSSLADRDRSGFLERLQETREWAQTMREWSDPTPRSLAGPLQERAKKLRYRVHQWSEETTRRLRKYVDEEIGASIPMLFYLALSIRAHKAVYDQRGTDPGQFLVPVTVNKYPDGDQRPLFGTHVSFWWFRIEPKVATDFTQLIDHLKRQRLELIKDEFHEQFNRAMSVTRYFPRWLNARMMRRETEGELASFFFSYTGELVPSVDQFFGGGIERMFHAPAPPASPGSSFVWSIRSGQLQLTHLFDQQAVSRDERERAIRTLRDDLEEVTP
jgi:hypothetical protein